MRRASVGLGMLVALVLVAPPATAGPHRWTVLGPSGGTATSIAVDPANPQQLYATISGNLFSSADGGATWSVLVGDFPGTDLAIDRMHPSIMYALAHENVLKSTDAGHTWRAVDTGLPKSSDQPPSSLADLEMD